MVQLDSSLLYRVVKYAGCRQIILLFRYNSWIREVKVSCSSRFLIHWRRWRLAVIIVTFSRLWNNHLSASNGYKPSLRSALFCSMVDKKWRSTSNELSFSDISSTFYWSFRFMRILLFFLAVLVSLETETGDFDDLTLTLFTNVYCLGFPFLPRLYHCSGCFGALYFKLQIPSLRHMNKLVPSWCNMQITWAQRPERPTVQKHMPPTAIPDWSNFT